jgi:hypothetical protein
MRKEVTRTLLLILLLACGGVLAFWWTLRDRGSAAPPALEVPLSQHDNASNAPLKADRRPGAPETRIDPAQQEQPEPVEPEVRTIPQPGALTGRVVDTGGRGLVGVSVLALGPDLKLGRSNYVKTGAEGRYRIEFEVGPCRLMVTTSDFSVIAAPGEIEVTSGETSVDDFVLGRPVTVTVRLLDAVGGAMSDKDRTGRSLRVTGVFVSANGNSTRLRGDVGLDGVARFEGVPLDAAEFTLNAIGYVVPPATNLHLIEGIENDAGALRLSEMETEPPPPSGSVAGRVVDPEGKPLAGVVMFAHRSAHKDHFAETFRSDDRTTSDDEGVFRFGALEAGKWYFIVASSEYTVREDPGSVTIAENTETEIEKAFVLGPPTTLKLRLVDEGGTPLAAGLRATATFGDRFHGPRLVRTVEADGVVLFNGAPGDATEVRLHVAGLELSDTLAVALKTGEVTDGGELKLAATR